MRYQTTINQKIATAFAWLVCACSLGLYVRGHPLLSHLGILIPIYEAKAAGVSGLAALAASCTIPLKTLRNSLHKTLRNVIPQSKSPYRCRFVSLSGKPCCFFMCFSHICRVTGTRKVKGGHPGLVRRN